MRSILVLCFTMACTSPLDDGGGAPAPTCTDVFYADEDGDGHGDPVATTTACAAPEGFMATSDDCDDSNGAIHPGAIEICDALDDDCDGSIDVGAVDEAVWYVDIDGDGFGGMGSITSCAMPAGYAAATGDCDDDDAEIRPDGVETCDDVDDDCDTLVDALDPDLVGGVTWYGDVDNDGYGDPAAAVVECDCPIGFVSDPDDCDDAAYEVHPLTIEICNGADDDCDGLTDDEDDPVLGTSLFYADVDGDALGDASSTTTACVMPKAHAAVDGDCDDADPAVGGAEVYFEDLDGDGHGAGTGRTTCTPDADEVAVAGDCRERNPDIYPGAPEVCDDGVDDNCDGLGDSDDPLLVLTVWYADADHDGYGTPTDTSASCDQPDGYVGDAADCDDGDDGVHPGAVEYCDGIDNDCTGISDDAIVYVAWYVDADGDGFGTSADVVSDCAQPSGYVLDSTDCDDTNAAVSPQAAELCSSGVDEDCDGHLENCRFGAADADAIVEGGDEYDRLGTAVAAADLDADGTADLLCGAPYVRDRGEAYVLFGPTAGTVAADGGVTIRTTTAHAQLGDAVAGGDADGDGMDDLLVGAPFYASAAYLFYGPVTADHASTEADATFVGDASAYAGTRLRTSADADGDALNDVVVSATGANDYAGEVYVVSGASSGSIDLSTDSTYVFRGAADMDVLGRALADLGDSNADGIEDFVLSAPGSGDGERVHLIEGGMAPGSYIVDGVAYAALRSSGLEGFGQALATLDYDNDGAVDLLVGATVAGDAVDPGTAYYGSGSVYGFLGPLSGNLDTTDAAVVWHSSTSVTVDQLGQTIAVGDVDGDKEFDVLIGAPGFSGTSGGAEIAYLQIGLASGAIDVDSLLSFPSMGSSVSFVPDWDGDGGDEIIIGATTAITTGGIEAGATYVFSSERFF